MYKAFALAALPAIALAVGDESGSDRDNAESQVLLERDGQPVMTLNTYNSSGFLMNSDERTYELHGDLDLVLTDVSDNQSAVLVGFCVQIKPEETAPWDCLES